MSEPFILRFYLDEGLRHSAEQGRHNFIAQIADVAETAGYRVEYRRNSDAERLKSGARRGYSLFHMNDPFHARALTIRRVYHYPFWAIEPSAKRWEWHVARSRFDASRVTRAEAERFYGFWQKRLFGEAPSKTTRDGYVYVPLQGRLLDHRSFQSCSPVEMLAQVLACEPTLPLVVTLHPGEQYTQAELHALDDLADENPRIRLESGDMERWLTGCDYVVTQNSSAAFSGFFFGKPAVLFARADFHHIAADVHSLGAGAAIARAREAAPDYAGYIHWFWQVMSINAGRPEAGDQIRAAFARGGWPT